MLRDGEVGAGGVAIWFVDWRREARGCGEGGTELRSGMPVMKLFVSWEDGIGKL